MRLILLVCLMSLYFADVVVSGRVNKSILAQTNQQNLTEFQQERIELAYAYIAGFRPYNYWVNTTECWDHYTNYSFIAKPNHQIQKDWLEAQNGSTYQKFNHSTQILMNISDSLLVCNSMLYTMSEYWHNRYLEYFYPGQYSSPVSALIISFLQNMASKQMSLKTIEQENFIARDRNDKLALAYNQGRKAREILIFEPYKEGAVVEGVVVDPEVDSGFDWNDRYYKEISLQKDNTKTGKKILKEGWGTEQNGNLDDFMQFSSTVNLIAGFLNQTQMTYGYNKTVFQTTVQSMWWNFETGITRLWNDVGYFNLLLSIDNFLYVTRDTHISVSALGYGYQESQAVLKYFALSRSSSRIMNGNWFYNGGLVVQSFKNLFYYFYMIELTRVKTPFDFGMELGLIYWHIFYPASINVQQIIYQNNGSFTLPITDTDEII